MLAACGLTAPPGLVSGPSRSFWSLLFATERNLSSTGGRHRALGVPLRRHSPEAFVTRTGDLFEGGLAPSS